MVQDGFPIYPLQAPRVQIQIQPTRPKTPSFHNPPRPATRLLRPRPAQATRLSDSRVSCPSVVCTPGLASKGNQKVFFGGGAIKKTPQVLVASTVAPPFPHSKAGMAAMCFSSVRLGKLLVKLKTRTLGCVSFTVGPQKRVWSVVFWSVSL